MRKFFFTALATFTFLSLSAQNYTLSDIQNGRFTPRGVPDMVSSHDGMHYYRTDAERTAVIKYAYATGNAVDTLFSTRTARNCTFDSFDGFLVSPDENRVLVFREREHIYLSLIHI